MNLNEMLKVLAEGINPETGEILPKNSETNKPESIRMLFRLAEELNESSETKPSKKLSEKERMEQNLKLGRRARSHFPWTEEEKENLKKSYKDNTDIKKLAVEFQRSDAAVAVQLERMGLITENERNGFNPILS